MVECGKAYHAAVTASLNYGYRLNHSLCTELMRTASNSQRSPISAAVYSSSKRFNTNVSISDENELDRMVL